MRWRNYSRCSNQSERPNACISHNSTSGRVIPGLNMRQCVSHRRVSPITLPYGQMLKRGWATCDDLTWLTFFQRFGPLKMKMKKFRHEILIAHLSHTNTNQDGVATREMTSTLLWGSEEEDRMSSWPSLIGLMVLPPREFSRCRVCRRCGYRTNYWNLKQ